VRRLLRGSVSQRVSEIKSQRVKKAKSSRVKEAKRQRCKEAKRQRQYSVCVHSTHKDVKVLRGAVAPVSLRGLCHRRCRRCVGLARQVRRDDACADVQARVQHSLGREHVRVRCIAPLVAALPDDRVPRKDDQAPVNDVLAERERV
jgi:hypothetical protein